MHQLEESCSDPSPPVRRHDDRLDRRDANQAVAASALVGLSLTGVAELAIALLTGSVGLLGDALHNLSDLSTSAVVLAGFKISKRPSFCPSHPYNRPPPRHEPTGGMRYITSWQR